MSKEIAKKQTTKVYTLILNRGYNLTEFVKKVKDTTGVNIELYRMSKIASGLIKNYKTNTARAIANTLGVNIDDILEDDE